MDNVVIFVRVSTNHQDVEYQLRSLTEYSNRMDYNIVKVFKESVSGTKKIDERHALKALLEYIKTNAVQRVLITEISRITRKVSNLHFILEALTEAKVSLFIQNYNLDTILPNGDKNIVASILIGLLGQLSEMEVQNHRQRISLGRDNAIRNNVKFGRKVGYRKPTDLFIEENAEAIKLLKKGYKIRHVATIVNKSPNTILKLKKYLMAA